MRSCVRRLSRFATPSSATAAAAGAKAAGSHTSTTTSSSNSSSNSSSGTRWFAAEKKDSAVKDTPAAGGVGSAFDTLLYSADVGAEPIDPLLRRKQGGGFQPGTDGRPLPKEEQGFFAGIMRPFRKSSGDTSNVATARRADTGAAMPYRFGFGRAFEWMLKKSLRTYADEYWRKHHGGAMAIKSFEVEVLEPRPETNAQGETVTPAGSSTINQVTVEVEVPGATDAQVRAMGAWVEASCPFCKFRASQLKETADALKREQRSVMGSAAAAGRQVNAQGHPLFAATGDSVSRILWVRR